MFHEQRNAKPKQFSNQTVNKMWYGKFGAGELIDGCPNLRKTVSLEVKLPPTLPFTSILLVLGLSPL